MNVPVIDVSPLVGRQITETAVAAEIGRAY
jgi:hypothetical protein